MNHLAHTSVAHPALVCAYLYAPFSPYLYAKQVNWNRSIAIEPPVDYAHARAHIYPLTKHTRTRTNQVVSKRRRPRTIRLQTKTFPSCRVAAAAAAHIVVDGNNLRVLCPGPGSQCLNAAAQREGSRELHLSIQRPEKESGVVVGGSARAHLSDRYRTCFVVMIRDLTRTQRQRQ